MRRIDQQLLWTGLGSFIIFLSVSLIINFHIAYLIAFGFSLGCLLSIWWTEFLTGQQASIMLLAQRQGLQYLPPHTRRFIQQVQQSILSPDTIAAYNPAHDRSLKSLVAALLGLFFLTFTVGTTVVLIATLILLLAEIRRPRIQKAIQIAWQTSS